MHMKTANEEAYIPKKVELLQAMNSAETSAEAANYLLQRVEKIIGNSRLIKKSPELMANAQEILAAVKEFVELVEFKFNSRASLWSGELPEPSGFKNMHAGLAEKTLKDLDGRFDKLRFDYAVNENGHFVRAYASEGKAVDAETSADLDKLFNAWLAQKDIVTEQGIFYKNLDNGKREKLSADKVEQLMTDPKESFVDYLKEKNITLTTKQREYPGEQRQEELKKSAESALQSMPVEEEEVGIDQEVNNRSDIP